MSKHHKPQLTAPELYGLTLADGCLFHTGKGKPVELPVAPAPLADTHGHLTHFHEHSAAHALARAALAGVRLLVVPLDPTDDATDPVAALGALAQAKAEAAELLAGPYAAAGLVPQDFAGYDLPWEDGLPLRVRIVAGAHPYGSELLDKAALARLEELLAHPSCAGVGEFGLDFGPWNELSAEAQLPAFRTQLRIAHAHGLPVELHLRDEPDAASAPSPHTAHVLAAQVLAEEGVPAAGCDLHCFTHSAQVMAPFVELGCHIAFGGAATFNASDDIRAAAAAVPERLILSETDSPYMAPVPLRGAECEPAHVALAAACVARARAEALGMPEKRAYEALWHNACAFFGLGEG